MSILFRLPLILCLAFALAGGPIPVQADPCPEKYEELAAAYHVKRASNFMAYTWATLPIYLLSVSLRESGHHNYILDHGSNLYQGIGFMGLVYNLAASSLPKWRNSLMVGTLATFTAANYLFEVAPSPLTTHTDWKDFQAGQIGALVFLTTQKAMDWFHSWRFHRKQNEPE